MTTAELQTYLVYREPKNKYHGALRNIFIFVDAKSCANAITIGRPLMKSDNEYKAAQAILVTKLDKFYI